ncbi:MAG: hypothetical protein C7B45_00770 [Sulfobacillus acidophilus]|uniref:EamA domain-containing protein n=1 Tax=Sulfobacillus acidophilus TaxID=53633 RepID=A0A2T2WPL0_9FIRM|nr:MAG: hypothetical protein C7B45_00770 [Sulfobacillus acidophilus]
MAEHRIAAIAMMASAAASYAFVTPLVKIAALHHVPIRLLTVYQYPLALTLFLIVVLFCGPWHPLPGRDWRLLIGIGAASATTSLAYYQSLRHLPASLAIILLFQFAWMLPVIAWIAGASAPTPRQWSSIAAIVLGTIIAAGLGIRQFSWMGLGLGLTAASGYALTLFWQSQTSAATSPWQRALISTAVAAAIVTVVYRPWIAPSTPFPPGLTLALGCAAGVFALALPLVLVYYSAFALGSVLTAILASLELPIAVFLSVVWLGEPVHWVQWLGVILILAAIVWGAASTARQTPTKPL